MTILNMTGWWKSVKVPLNDISTLSVEAGDTEATITWTDVWNLTVNGVLLNTWNATKLVRKVGSAPSDSSDWTLVLTETVADTYSSTGYTDTGLTNWTTYYYKAFSVGSNWLESGSNDESATPSGVTERPDIDTYSVDQTKTMISNPHGIWVSDDGTKLYLHDNGNNGTKQYSLPYWQLTNVSNVETTSWNVAIRWNFCVMPWWWSMFCCSDNNTLYKITMPTAHSFTGSSVQTKSSFVSYYPGWIWVSPDGLFVFILEGSDSKLYRYALWTAFDISTIDTSNPQSLNVQVYSASINISPTWKKMFVWTWAWTMAVYQYDLTTPYDLSTATYSNKSLSVSWRAYFAVTGNGKYLYQANTDSWVITQYVSSAV